MNIHPLPIGQLTNHKKIGVKTVVNYPNSHQTELRKAVYNRPILAISLIFSLLVGGYAHAGADPSLFPRPPGIEAAVQFWTKVFTDIDTKHGYIHDDTDLDIIYENIHLSSKYSRRQNNKRIKSAKKNYQKILRTLSRGKRKGLSDEESRILKLWPAGVKNSTLKTAMGRLRFQLGQSDKFEAGLIRSGAWRSHILDNLKKMGLPHEIAALPHVESSFNPKAYSSVGAAGLWQFTRSTGKRFMRVDHIVDERMDPFMASIAAARLLENNYAVTGTWPLAITAYNHGAAGMRNAAKQVGTTDIDKIIKRYRSRSFKFASRNFYTAFLAVNDIQDDYEKYFGKVTVNPAVKDEIVEIPDFMSVNTVSQALGISKHELERKNPALRSAVWTNNKLIPKGFDLRITPGSTNNAPEKLLLNVASNQRFSKQKPDAYHRVQRNQTLSTIAARYGVRVKDIAALNNIRNRSRIRIGQVLRLPQHGQKVEPIRLAKAQKKTTPRINKAGYYKVRRGDSIIRIASKFGLKQKQLLAWNNLNRRKPIYPGQMLRVEKTIPTVTETPIVLASADDTIVPDSNNNEQPDSSTTEETSSSKDDPTTDTSAAQADTESDDQIVNEKLENNANDESEIGSESTENLDPDNLGGSKNTAYMAMISEQLDATAKLEDSSEPSEDNIAGHLPAIAQTETDIEIPPISDENQTPISLEPAPETVSKEDSIFETPTGTKIQNVEQFDVQASDNNVTNSEKAATPETIAERTEVVEEEAELFADPTDYTVSNKKTIEIQAAETLGHYAEWLGIRASRLRRINRMKYRTPVVIGQHLKLDFAKVTPEEFVRQRTSYHKSVQEAYFERFQITESVKHKLRRGQSIWQLAKYKYKIPLWLLRQYNPDLTFSNIQAGMTITIPHVKTRLIEN